jgi:hypothetical protein
MEEDVSSWRLTKGAEALGRLLAAHSNAFENRILTTNFDPLIEIAIRKAGGRAASQSMKTDGSLYSLVEDDDTIKVIHLHGYWRSNLRENRSLLNSPSQIQRPRQELLGGLADLIRDDLVVVLAYGGWDDIFTGALRELRTSKELDILWTFHANDSPELREMQRRLFGRLGDHPEIVTYAGVDTNRLFPSLVRHLAGMAALHTGAYGIPPQTQPESLHTPALPLDDPRITPEIYGPKSSALSRLIRSGANVPFGHCISLHGTSVEELEQSGELRRIWTALSSDNEKLIVRSSASVEDAPAALFPGRFAGKRDVATFTDLVVGVSRCERSAIAPPVTDYRQSLGLADEPIRMSVLIQSQVEAVFAGVAFTRAPDPYDPNGFLVEMVEGTADQLLTGETTGSLYHISDDADPHRYTHLAGPHLDMPTLTRLLSSIASACREVEEILESPQDIEWVWDGDRIYIVQARPIAVNRLEAGWELRGNHTEGRSHLISLPMAETWGLKAAAALYFRGSGWGASNATVIAPRAARSFVAEELARRPVSRNGTVVRFSYRTNVALPVGFVPPGGDVVKAFFELRTNPDWVGIISDYVYVENSFEAYISPRALLVEHVPGNWEPDNLLSPDVFLWTDAGFEALRSLEQRRSSVELPSEGSRRTELHRNVPPLDPSVAAKWADKMHRYFSKIRTDLAADLPVNVHFVADAEGKWYFLNIRPTTEVDIGPSDRAVDDGFKLNRLYIVVEPEDVHEWDGDSRILVNSALDRAAFSRIASVAVALRTAGIEEVLCTFGVLSHPAILLREFGLAVRPLYFDHEVLNIEAARW